MSSKPTPEQEMTKVVTDTLASQLLFGNTNDKAGILARAVVKALKTNPGCKGWLIDHMGVHRVTETDMRDSDGDRHTYEVYTENEPSGEPDE